MSTAKRVLFIEGAGNLWGSERSMLALLKAMPKLELAVCCPAGTPLGAELKKFNVRSLPYLLSGLHEKSRLHRLWAAFGVLRACWEFRPDVIYLNQSGSYRLALVASMVMKLPIIAHVRIFEDVAYLAKQKPRANRLRALIAISAAVEEEVRRFPELQAIPTHRIYNGYEPAGFGTNVADIENVASRIACVGRLVPIKGQDILVGALAFMKSAGINVNCLIVGDGDTKFTEVLKDIATKEGLESSIRWCGFVGEVVPLLRSCSILVCPSHREPLGRVILEAWEAGAVPVVFSGGGGSAEIVRASQGGFVYEEQTPQCLANALRDVLALDAVQKERIIANGRSWMADNNDLATYGAKISDIVMEVAQIPASPKVSPGDNAAREPTKRVLFIEGAGNLWGSERSMLALLKAMPKLELAVCCPAGTPLGAELKKFNVRSLPYLLSGLHEKSRLHRLWASFGVLRACWEFRPDVIYLNQSGSYRLALVASMVMKLPIIAHVRIFEDVAYLAKQKPRANRLRALIAISAAVDEEVRRFPELQAIPTHRIYDGYKPEEFETNIPDEKSVACRIACVGRLVPIKGQDILVGALAFMKSAGINVNCLIVGDGDTKFTEVLKDIATKEGLESSIRWCGFVGEVVSLLRSCSILVCPSHREPLGRVILEAWEAGAVPVVFSGGGGSAEIVRASQGGFVYEEQTPQCLANALRDVLALDAVQKERIIANGRSWMADNNDLATYGAKISDIVMNVFDD